MVQRWSKAEIALAGVALIKLGVAVHLALGVFAY